MAFDDVQCDCSRCFFIRFTAPVLQELSTLTNVHIPYERHLFCCNFCRMIAHGLFAHVPNFPAHLPCPRGGSALPPPPGLQPEPSRSRIPAFPPGMPIYGPNGFHPSPTIWPRTNCGFTGLRPAPTSPLDLRQPNQGHLLYPLCPCLTPLVFFH